MITTQAAPLLLPRLIYSACDQIRCKSKEITVMHQLLLIATVQPIADGLKLEKNLIMKLFLYFQMDTRHLQWNNKESYPVKGQMHCSFF